MMKQVFSLPLPSKHLTARSRPSRSWYLSALIFIQHLPARSWYLSCENLNFYFDSLDHVKTLRMLNCKTFHKDSNYFLKLYDCTFNYYKEKICEKDINFQQLFKWFIQKGWNKCFPFLNLENIYLLALDHRNTRKRRGISSKLTIQTLKRRPAVFTVSFVHTFHLFPVFLLLTFNRKMFAEW